MITKEKQRNQVKSKFYYIFWGVATASVLFRRIYDSLYESLVPSTIPAAVLVIAKYQYQTAFVADQEINLLACLTEIMVECEFK